MHEWTLCPGTVMSSETGKLIIISGPSGAGKSTVLSLISESDLPFEFSISATTRSPRAGEADGEDYLFLSLDEFCDRREKGEFLECKEVFGRGDWYGTLRCQVATGLKRGKWVVLEIDVEGAASVIAQVPDATTIFLHPGSMEELESRLRKRGTETEASIQRRLEVARDEMQRIDQYQHQVVNDSPNAAAAEIMRIAQAAAPNNSIIEGC